MFKKSSEAVLRLSIRYFLQAIEFVSNQHDDDLWEELIKQCMNKPEMVSCKLSLLINETRVCSKKSYKFFAWSCLWQVGVLLEHTVGNLDPLYIVNRVPNGLEIPR